MVARTAVRYGYWSPKNLMKAVYGRQSVLAVPDLPSNLAEFAAHARASWHLSPEEIALRHTMVGYYTHFLGAERQAEVIACMASKGGNLQVRLGVCAGSAVAPKWFQLCPKCRQDDLATFGESFWRRSHHLPGVLVCHRHGVPLLRTSIPFRPVGRHEHLAVPLEDVTEGLSPLVNHLHRSETVKAIAARSAQLLSAPARACATILDYREDLMACGFSSGRQGFARLRGAFEEHFSPVMLEAALRVDGRDDHLGWLAEALRRPRRRLHPFKYVLLSHFVDAKRAASRSEPPQHEAAEQRAKAWRVYRSPELRKEAAGLANLGLKTYAVARALDVDWKTASRLLEPMPPETEQPVRDILPDRAAWTSLATRHSGAGKKQLRGEAPALYARLYRNDRPWLLAWRPNTSTAGSPVPLRRVDWATRDAEVVDLIRRQVAATLRQIPPRRASSNHVLGALGLRALLKHNGPRLPRSVSTLAALRESVESYQLRRLTTTLTGVAGNLLSDSQLLWRARINRARLPDGGAALLALARERAREARHDV
ncbi:TnsD family Tn7-like transposition protein [Variovorax sp. J31P207]|uniref:TnsD family Tn7-like transposition protein n=1 Tax=Variovorax sp. J31P207 TaxID=3053510 RepID=UPI002577D1D1|nr:TnsD family Tn7-like transposition protein [Variovorax sp. J31P207]MDM0068786.1 TnsD family Tn7-like transposition protein [Variovorax sp. J31P207]